ncbi:MAG: hypothetical protein ABEH43_08475, partial [Flavobacteriales bacterium]
VAEMHLSRSYIRKIAKIFAIDIVGWEFFEHQLMVLIDLLCEAFPDEAPELFWRGVEFAVEENVEMSDYTCLYESLHYLDTERYKDRIIHILQHENLDPVWLLSSKLADIQFTPALPHLQAMVQGMPDDDFDKRDVIGAIEQLKNGEVEIPNQALPAVYKQGDWFEFYSKYEVCFYDKVHYETFPIPQNLKYLHSELIRHCPCGSGKMVKDCCWSEKGRLEIKNIT